MDAVLQAAAMYLVLMILFKIAGRRSLSDLTTFDFILLLIIGEATQQALLGDDFFVTNSILIIATLMRADAQQRHPEGPMDARGVPAQLLHTRRNQPRRGHHRAWQKRGGYPGLRRNSPTFTSTLLPTQASDADAPFKPAFEEALVRCGRRTLAPLATATGS